ncbi:MAG: hypothetical protein ABIT37_21095 [Luteolibacter sp.]
MKTKTIIIATLLPLLALLASCKKDDSAELKAIREELKKSNKKLEDMQRNQRIEREGKAIENQKSYFQ